jgi:hypothetical protein
VATGPTDSAGSVGARGAVTRCGFGRGFAVGAGAGVGGGGSSVMDACNGTVSGGVSISTGQNENAACTAIDKARPAMRPGRPKGAVRLLGGQRTR